MPVRGGINQGVQSRRPQSVGKVQGGDRTHLPVRISQVPKGTGTGPYVSGQGAHIGQ